MQTFLPYRSFTATAAILDRQRLGKQRVEVLQILKSLNGEGRGWKTHPAVLMWRNHEQTLIDYGVVICDEWIARGYKDTCRDKILSYRKVFPEGTDRPSWLGDVLFHKSHKSNLKRKDPDYYQFDVPSDLEYVWPVSTEPVL